MDTLTPESQELRKALAGLDQGLFTAKTVRSLVIDFFSANKQFVKEFQRLTSPNTQPISSENWAKLFEAKNDWRFCEAATEFLRVDRQSNSASHEVIVQQIILVIGERAGHNHNIVSRVFDLNQDKDHATSSGDGEDSLDRSTAKGMSSLTLEEQHKALSAFRSSKDSTYLKPVSSSTGQAVSTLQDNNSAKDEHSSNLIAGTVLGLLGLGLAVAIGTGLEERNTNSATSVADLSAEMVEVSNQANAAVLVCENKQAIEKMKSLRNRLQESEPTHQSMIKELDNKVEKANANIKYLDQKGKYGAYKEYDCLYGFQWYDNDASNAHRAFIAVSNKCLSPIARFTYHGKNDKLVGTTKFDLKKKMNTIKVSYGPAESETTRFNEVTCNQS